MEFLEEKVLISRTKQGDEEAFSVLYKQYYPYVFSYVLKLSLDEEKSKDIAQETMLKSYIKISSFNGESQFSTWLMSIATRQFLDVVRKQKREKDKLKQLKTMLSRSLDWRAKKEGLQWSDTFLDFNELELDYKAPILLKHYYGYQYEEIARMLQMKEGTVKSRIHHGLKKNSYRLEG